MLRDNIRISAEGSKSKDQLEDCRVIHFIDDNNVKGKAKMAVI